MSQINKSSNKGILNNFTKSFLSIFAILAMFGSVYGGYVYFKDNLSTDNNTDTAKAASTTFSNGNISFDKKYVVGGIEYDTLDNANAVAQGSTVTVRLRYNNTGDTALSGASIKDTLPGGFTLQDGSVKACLNPSVTETICGANIPAATANTTLFGSTGTSPIAGLYDGADTGAVGTAVASSSGLVEMGKKKVIGQSSADNAQPGNGFGTEPNGYYRGCLLDNIDFTAGANNGTTCDYKSQTIITGNRYLTYQTLDFEKGSGSGTEPNGYYRGCLISLVQPFLAGNVSITTGSACATRTSLDLLAKRYLTYQTIDFEKGTGTSGTEPNGYYRGCFKTVISTGNTNTTLNNGGCNVRQSLDLLDTTRGSGYIEYKMTAPSFTTPSDQKYSTAATLSTTGSTITALNDGTVGNGTTLGDITVSATPRPNGDVTKEYSIDGINWCDKLDGTPSTCPTVAPGEPIKVRLRYENTGNASATVASIKDSLPSNKFSYIPNTFKNCLNPDYPSSDEVICDTLSDTNKNTAFTTLTSTTGISPVAGLYDANSASAAGGTSVTSTSGTLEIGKKRYLNNIVCSNTANGVGSAQTISASSILNLTPNYTTTDCATYFGATASNYSSPVDPDNVDIFGSRYLHDIVCSYNTNGIGTAESVSASNTITISPNYTTTDCATYFSNSASLFNVPDHDYLNLLGQRYVHSLVCVTTSTGTAVSQNILADNILSKIYSTSDCVTYFSNTVASYSGTDHDAIDLLSSSRSTGYIYYEMTSASDTTAGTYGTTTTALNIADVGFVSTVPTGSATDITIANDPAFSIKKVLANIGTGSVCPTTDSSYTSTINGVNAGDKICVRLKYQNKTNGAVSNAVISDSDTSGLALLPNSSPTNYIANSLKNCLTPETGTELCTTDSGMGGAIPNTVFSFPPLVADASRTLEITPHAGFYGIATNDISDTMEMGKVRYFNLNQCTYSATSSTATDFYSGVINTYPNTALRAGTNASNTIQTSPNCGPGGVGYNPYSDDTGVQNIDLTGNRYFNLNQCTYSATSSTATDFYSGVINTYPNTALRAGTNASNTIQTSPNCGPGGVGYNPYSDDTGVQNIDLTGNRYFNLNQCTYSATSSTATDFYSGVINTYPNTALRAGTNASNTIQTSPNCGPGGVGYNPYSDDTGVQNIDLLYTPNGRGYIQYQLQTSSTNSVSSLTLPNVSLSGDGQTTSTSNAVINFASTPLTPTDIPSLTVTCGASGVGAGVGSAVVNSTTTCSFPIPPNKTLPTDFKISIGTGTINQLNCNNTTTPNTPGCNSTNSAVAQACTLASGTVTCNNIPTGNSIGAMPIYGNLGSGTTATKTATGETVNITGINFGGIVWNFTPNQGGTAPLFRSTDNTTVNINNFKTIIDPTPTSNTRYTCNLEYRKINDRLATSTPTWTSISTTPVPYTTGNTTNSGCSFTLTKAMRANNLNYSLRLTITDTTITTPTTTNPNTYTFYNEYIYRFQGAGVASGG